MRRTLKELDAVDARPQPLTWTVESVPAAQATVCAFELLLKENAERLERLEELWPGGVVVVGWEPARRFALFWEDDERVYTIASDTFAGACAQFENQRCRMTA